MGRSARLYWHRGRPEHCVGRFLAEIEVTAKLQHPHVLPRDPPRVDEERRSVDPALAAYSL